MSSFTVKLFQDETSSPDHPDYCPSESYSSPDHPDYCSNEYDSSPDLGASRVENSSYTFFPQNYSGHFNKHTAIGLSVRPFNFVLLNVLKAK